jgi:hypothetical protein
MSKPTSITIKCDRFRLQQLQAVCAGVSEGCATASAGLDRLIGLSATDLSIKMAKKLCEPRNSYNLKLSAREAAALEVALLMVIKGTEDQVVLMAMRPVVAQIHQTYC